MREQEEISSRLEAVGDDMDAMQELLDRLDKLTAAAVDLDVALLDKKIDQARAFSRSRGSRGPR